MQPARIKPHAKEHTNNPVQRPNFRGHAAGDGEVTREGTPTDDHPRDPEGRSGKTVEGRTQVAVLPRCQILHRHEHACSTSTSRHDISNHSASCWPRGKSLHVHEHARRTGTHAT